MLGKGGGNSGGKRRVRMKTSKQVSRYEAGTKQVRIQRLFIFQRLETLV